MTKGKLCEACRLRYPECSIRECPKKPGHYICYQCCRKCKWHYRGLCGTWGCKAFDAAREEEREAVVAKSAASEEADGGDGR